MKVKPGDLDWIVFEESNNDDEKKGIVHLQSQFKRKSNCKTRTCEGQKIASPLENNDTLGLILSHLPPQQLCTVIPLVSKKWYQLSQTKYIMIPLLTRCSIFALKKIKESNLTCQKIIKEKYPWLRIKSFPSEWIDEACSKIVDFSTSLYILTSERPKKLESDSFKNEGQDLNEFFINVRLVLPELNYSSQVFDLGGPRYIPLTAINKALEKNLKIKVKYDHKNFEVSITSDNKSVLDKIMEKKAEPLPYLLKDEIAFSKDITFSQEN